MTEHKRPEHPRYNSSESCPKCGWMSMQAQLKWIGAGLQAWPATYPQWEMLQVTCRCGYTDYRTPLDGGLSLIPEHGT